MDPQATLQATARYAPYVLLGTAAVFFALPYLWKAVSWLRSKIGDNVVRYWVNDSDADPVLYRVNAWRMLKRHLDVANPEQAKQLEAMLPAVMQEAKP